MSASTGLIWQLVSGGGAAEKVMLLRRDEIVDGSIIENPPLGRVDVGLDEI
ncbi:MAG: hypothetical protein IPK32_16830, partial [Verrucomicrobiaceae bacterium]|nr:hypothetical protein [Verrucomicrobiaceae bacterium]